ncbi:MAG TPA: hypothetical protein VL598_12760 [Trinickia sp.]|jgi:hypothetical protein|uniref:hypothetical protein n=1 Tax=Trinickia sp. TaxID=2571163 RepID=UPI002C361420|nr:hypothetical protein [Trinickia sp.]HTI18529.1 hypothetical protein [Trinickia sp.]
MTEQLYLYGVYSIHVRPIPLAGAHWDAEYEIRHRDKAVQPWTTVGGDDGYPKEDDAMEAAHLQAVADIEHGAGVPKPKAFP